MKRTWIISAGVLSILLVVLGNFAWAVSTMRLSIDSFEEFKKGELKSTSISSDGKLFIAPELNQIYATKEDMIWDIAVHNNKAYLATGNDGKVFIVNLEKKKGELLCDQKEMEIYAIAVGSNGEVFFGASPGGKIYKCTEDGEPVLFFETNEDYVWDLVFDKDGNLYAATGKEGKIFKISPDGKGEVYFDTPSANVMTLAFNPKGTLLAGTQGKGFIYRIDKKDKGFVLYEPSQDEVRQIICVGDGTIYAVVNAERAPRGAIVEEIMKMLEESKRNKAQGKSTPKKVVSKAKSEILKITPEGFVTSIWAPKEQPVHCLYFDPVSSLLFVSVGKKGYLYQVDDKGDYVLTTRLDDTFILSIEPSGESLLLGTGSQASLYQLDLHNYKEGVYLSQPLDAGSPVKWGKLEYLARLPQKSSKISFRYRVGNTSVPDDSWTEWSKYVEPENEFLPLEVPLSRFIQIEIKLNESGKTQKPISKTSTRAQMPISDRFIWMPVLDYCRLYYIHPNLAPQIKSLTIESVQPKKPPTPPTKKALNSKTKGTSSGSAYGALEKPPDSNPKKVSIKWKATDPNNDQLIYEIYFKGEEESNWKLIEDELKQTNYTFSTATIPDGKYRLKVIASDEPSNLSEMKKTAEFVSEIFIVDNTPPEITKLSAKPDKNKTFIISAEARDTTSLLVSARYSVDAEDLMYLLPADGLFDSTVERFSFKLSELEPGEHTLSLLVTDGMGNSATKKIILHVK
ncbi:hypothetical protein J7M23_03475 [Candidatus Sumerlaeota bacterium]|nr:hypothetical protein [Candidatus Sumerlaeota bacterium]